ncbi:hypothetical protein L6R52_35740 [Myxococcota bacterium]|nr:hypothetical protein [Myxococcota bacterium]
MRLALTASSLVLASLALAALPRAASAGNPWEELMGPGKPRLWNDPEGRFSIDLPVGWTAGARRGMPNVVDFIKEHPDHGYTARVSVEMRTLPPGVKTAHFAVKVQDETKRAARAFRLLEADKVEVSGVTAHRTYFTFHELSNAELSNEAVQLAFLVGERGFVITFVCAAGARGVFWEDFEKMLRGFSGRGPGETRPMPKERKRIRAGEMVNPDAVQY